MCGRYTLTDPDPRLLRFRFGLSESAEIDQPPRYNVAPTDPVLAIRLDGEGRPEPGILRWGLIPQHADPETFDRLLINARAETVAEASAFREPFRTGRCLIVADGFYEWRQEETGKKPVWITRPSREPFAFAGLWEVWRGPDRDQDPIASCTIITGEPNEKMAEVHDRMPVMLPPSAWDEWLNADENDLDLLGKFLVPAPSELITIHPVSTEVNNVRNQGPQLMDPVDPPDPAEPT